MQRKGNKLLIQLCSAILLFFTTSWYALATECYIESNAAGAYDIVKTQLPSVYSQRWSQSRRKYLSRPRMFILTFEGIRLAVNP